MSNGINIVWHDSTTAELRNDSGQVLTQVRIQVVGDSRIAGRRQWTQDLDTWNTNIGVRLVRIDLRGKAPQLRLRFHVGNTNLSSRDWFTDMVPLSPPLSMQERDPWSLAARTQSAR
jgi:hypothetical protein